MDFHRDVATFNYYLNAVLLLEKEFGLCILQLSWAFDEFIFL